MRESTKCSPGPGDAGLQPGSCAAVSPTGTGAEGEEEHPDFPFWCPDKLPVAVLRAPPPEVSAQVGVDTLPHTSKEWAALGSSRGHRTPHSPPEQQEGKLHRNSTGPM